LNNLKKTTLFFFILIILVSCKSQQTIEDIGFIQPEFEVVSIIIYQAELINTQFETVLKIVNPNKFDVQLYSIKYRLYGNGMLWAEDTAEDIILVPAESTVEAKFRFSMNFINMNRRLLSDIIDMRSVQYAFIGEAQLQVNVSRVSPFTVNFDISGLSDVKPKAD
jgi:LEA14-like dessication related protein